MSSKRAPGQEQTRATRRLYWGALALCTALLAWSIVAIPYLPTNDGPQAVFSAHVAAHHDDPGSIYGRQFEVTVPWANLGFSLVYRPLYAVLGWDAALRVALVTLALSWAWGFALLVARLCPPRRFVGLLGFAFAFSWPFYMGFFSYAAASAATMWLLALAMPPRDPPWKTRLAFFVGTLALLPLHAVGGLVGIATLGGVRLAAAERGCRKKEALWLALTAVPVLLFFMVLAGSRADLANAPFSEATTWEPAAELLGALPGLLLPGPRWRGVLAGVLVMASLALATWGPGAPTRADRALAIVGGVLCVASVACPTHLAGWQHFSARFLALGAPLAVASMPLEKLGRREIAAAAAVASAVAGSLLVTLAFHRRLAQGCGDAYAALAAPIRRTGPRLPISLEVYCEPASPRHLREVPFQQALNHAGLLYPVVQGGTLPWAFQGTSGIHALRIRSEVAPTPPSSVWALASDPGFIGDARLRRAALTDVAVWGMSYEDVILIAARPEDKQVMTLRGFETQLDQGSLWIGAFMPCTFDVHIAGGRDPVRVAWGPWGLRESAEGLFPPDAVAAERTVSMRSLCGDLWVRVDWPLSGGGHCREAREDGKMRIKAARQPTAAVTCSAP